MDKDLDIPAISCKEAGKRGGNKVKEKYGTEFYQAIGRKGGQATKTKHGPAFYENIGHIGGKANKKG